ncbi:MAG TPA: regulatory iron-sulfur-containing complex subunit RicT, partial [Flavipsychrobacter sp.]|nr:regulatory iron-sulfur-containing complex subunit RicT [Flavipsychrobacter sp.]
MGCGNCGTGANGKPSGCKSNGGCSTGGCNRMNVFDWLSALPLYDGSKPYPIIEVSFNKGSRKDFYRNNTNHILEKGEWVAVEGTSGFDLGQVSLTGELVKLQMKKYGVEDSPAMKRMLRIATEDDIKSYNNQKEREAEVLIRSRAISRSQNLEMKLCEVEIQADGKKATFFYTADQRVDFRELIKVYASEFKVKVEMRQIGARQESGKVGGIGSCGRELCCSTWLTDFKSVNTTAARYQNLSINQTKLSGQCGRLKCCLNYELDTYMDALSVFPDNADSIETTQGVASLQKRDIFKNLMWYSYGSSNKQYPLTIIRVKEIQKLNKQGIKPEELQAVELETGPKQGVKVDVGFVNDVGQISLKALEKSDKKKRQNDNRQQATAGNQQPRGQHAKQYGNKPPLQQQQKSNSQQQKPQNQQRPNQQQAKPNQPQQKQQGNNPNPNNRNRNQKPKQP